MKKLTVLLSLATIALAIPRLSGLGIVVFALLLAAVWLQPTKQLGTATLILPILTGKVIEAFKTMVPELNFFSTDWGMSGSNFASPVKYGQEVISQMALVPTVSDHTPGDDLTVGAQNAKDLVTDVKVKVDRCKKVVVKLPTADAVSLTLDGAFQSALKEGGIALGRAIVSAAVQQMISDNFSKSITETVSNHDYDTLSSARRALNAQGALTPRFMLGNTDAIGNIAADSRVASGFYQDQRITGDPYVMLNNIEGFQSVREFPLFPLNNLTIGAFTAATTDIITLNAHGLSDGTRIRFTTTGTLPAGLSLNTNYFVRDSTTNTFKVAATLGGAAVDITDTGTGTHTAARFEQLNSFAFEKRAIHIALRQMVDNLEMARTLGIPVPIADHTETDPATGITFTSFMWIDVKTHDIYVAFVVMFGLRGGRAISGSTTPGAEAAGTALDYAGLRVVES